MIFVGIDPGTDHCAFCIVELSDIYELNLQTDTFECKINMDSCTVLESFTINTAPDAKASIEVLSNLVAKQLMTLAGRYSIDGGLVVEIQPFVGAKVKKKQYVCLPNYKTITTKCSS